MKVNYKPEIDLFKQVFYFVAFCVLLFYATFAMAEPIQLYHKAEGLYHQKKYDRALIYYQGAAESIRGGKTSRELKSTLKRIIDISHTMGMTDIFYVYVKKYQKYWPEDILKQYSLPGTDFSSYQNINVKKDYAGVDSMGKIVKKICDIENYDIKNYGKTGYVAKCIVYRPDELPWEYSRVLRPAEKSSFLSDRQGFIAFLIREASVKFAEHKGYLTESFGSENYKMLSISKVSLRITDVVNRRIVFESEDQDDEDKITSRGETRE